MYENLIHFLEQHLLSCWFVKWLGIECPGCGIQRAFVLLLKGDLLKSIQTYPPLIPLMLMVLILFLHLRLNFKQGPHILIALFIFNAILILINYFFKFNSLI